MPPLINCTRNPMDLLKIKIMARILYPCFIDRLILRVWPYISAIERAVAMHSKGPRGLRLIIALMSEWSSAREMSGKYPNQEMPVNIR